MSDEIKDTIETVKGLVEAIPIYEDLLQPAVIEIGEGLHTISKVIHIVLAPVSAMIWGYEQIKDYVQTSLELRLQDVPFKNIISPDPAIAGPALEALRYFGHKEELREMFANLLATAMNSEKAIKAHPSFVEVLKQINPDEAKIISLLKDDVSKPIITLRAMNLHNNHYAEPIKDFSLLPYIADCQYPQLGASYLINIARLGLAKIDYGSYNTYPNAYEPIIDHPIIITNKDYIESVGKKVDIKRGTFTRTDFGKNFYEACVI